MPEDRLDFQPLAGDTQRLETYKKRWSLRHVRRIGALDTPVPYAPPLEEFYLVSEAEIEQAARLLVAY